MYAHVQTELSYRLITEGKNKLLKRSGKGTSDCVDSSEWTV